MSDHDHHGHHHHDPGHAHPPAGVAPSILRLSALERLGVAAGLIALLWAAVFWWLRRRMGPVTFVERQIAHVWAASMIAIFSLDSFVSPAR